MLPRASDIFFPLVRPITLWGSVLTWEEAVIKKTSTWTQVVTCSRANHNNQNTNHQPKKRQDADPPARFASHHPKDSKANSERGKSPNRNNHKRFAQDTVVTTHCVATDSKTCSKRISCHPVKWDARSTLLPRRQQKVAFAIHCRLAQPLRVLSRVLGHVPMFRIRAGTNRHKPEQEKDDIGDQVSFGFPERVIDLVQHGGSP